MSKFKLEIRETTHPEIIKFVSNQFLTDQSSHEFNNIDEAKISPLAQELFFIPFVKAVYITPSFIAVARHPMVQWQEVQDDICEQLESFLNNGGVVIESSLEKPKLSAVTVYAENTPNPAAMRFVANKILAKGTFEFKSADQATPDTLIAKLFEFPFVKELFVSENYLSVTKTETASWDEIVQEVREFILKELQQNTEVTELSGAGIEAESEAIAGDEDETVVAIKKILDEYVKPAVAGDGGHIRFEGYSAHTKTVTVLLQGACSGCPSSTYTLKNGIENMFRQMMGEHVQHIEAVNG
jgi:Fe-S cluster biogenesis protein NfuA